MYYLCVSRKHCGFQKPMISNDEPVYLDKLGHYDLAKRVGHRILKCTPPYVIGVCGSWGSGKTSFLRMLWAYLGGPFECLGHEYGELIEEERTKWFPESQNELDESHKNSLTERELHLIWFNPWQHQFETSPLVALLNEIRTHFSHPRRALNEAAKLLDVATHAMLNLATDSAKGINIQLPGAKGILERGREYEAEHFSTALASQRFRYFFEGAIQSVTGKTGKKGLLVIFIDDLDRCEGEVAYRLLEALKLYVNADNCVYVLGIDQNHIERSIAKALSGAAQTWDHRPFARDYLSKIFQNLFHLPVPRHMSNYLEHLLDRSDASFRTQLADLFGVTDTEWKHLVDALDKNLPHNPRKMKSFISSWRLHLDSLPEAEKDAPKLNWRLSLILHYLAQFEEPLFRKIEEAPAFYSNHVVRFCQKKDVGPSRLFDGLELPYAHPTFGSESEEKGELDSSPPPRTPEEADRQTEDKGKSLREPRVFWISRLVNELATEGMIMDDERIYRHLLRTGGKVEAPPREAAPRPEESNQ